MLDTLTGLAVIVSLGSIAGVGITFVIAMRAISRREQKELRDISAGR